MVAAALAAALAVAAFVAASVAAAVAAVAAAAAAAAASARSDFRCVNAWQPLQPLPLSLPLLPLPLPPLPHSPRLLPSPPSPRNTLTLTESANHVSGAAAAASPRRPSRVSSMVGGRRRGRACPLPRSCFESGPTMKKQLPLAAPKQHLMGRGCNEHRSNPAEGEPGG